MKKTLLLMALPALIVGCGDSSSSSSSTASTVSISGSITNSTTALTASGLYLARPSLSDMSVGEIVFGNAAVTSSGDKVVCITSEPPVARYTATIDSNGNFSMDIPKGLSVGCEIQSGTDSSTKASFLVSKTSGKDMRGHTQVMDRFVLGSGASLGNISYGDDKKATITESTFGSAIETVAITNPFNPTGTWTVSAVDFTLPTGYEGLCAANSQDCSGPAAGESLYIKRLDGYEWSNGARTGNQKYGIMVWGSQQAFQSCGSKLGVSYDDAKTYGGIDLTESGVNGGAYNWSTSVTKSGTTYNLTDGWKIASATSSYSINNCQMATVGGLPGWKCTENQGGADGDYQVSLGGGCINTATNEAVNVTNWTGMNCTNETLTGTFSGYNKNTCTATALDHDSNTATAAINVSCTFTSGCFTAAGAAASCDNGSGAGHFNWSNVGTIVAQNALCSSISTADDKHALAQLQCYSNAYWQAGISRETTACLPSLRTDYSATSAANFIIAQNGPQKAETEYVFEQLDYKNDNTASFMMNEEYSKGAQVNSNGQNMWINCKVAEKFSMTFTKRTDSKILADFTVETTLIDTKKACFANKSSLGIGTFKSMFYMTK